MKVALVGSLKEIVLIFFDLTERAQLIFLSIIDKLLEFISILS